MQSLHAKFIKTNVKYLDETRIDQVNIADETCELEINLNYGPEKMMPGMSDMFAVPRKLNKYFINIVLPALYNLKYQFGIDDTIETFEIGSHTALASLDPHLKRISDVDELNYNDLFKTNVLTGWITRDVGSKKANECFPCEIDDVQQFPTIIEQNIGWVLNEDQHIAFLIQCLSFFKHLLLLNPYQGGSNTHSRLIERITSSLQCKRILHSLYGSAGTGKSIVIHAYLGFVYRWKCAHMVVVTATSGIAAVLLSAKVRASTYHSALGLRINTKMIPRGSAKFHRKCSEIFCFLIDDICMMGCSGYERIDKTLRYLRGKPTELFGGLDLFISGDLTQHGTREHPLYKSYWTYIAPRDISDNQMRGNILYHTSINLVTVLH